jgi:hypothetical protein
MEEILCLLGPAHCEQHHLRRTFRAAENPWALDNCAPVPGLAAMLLPKKLSLPGVPCVAFENKSLACGIEYISGKTSSKPS